jgi:hypothetical protein
MGLDWETPLHCGACRGCYLGDLVLLFLLDCVLLDCVILHAPNDYLALPLATVAKFAPVTIFVGKVVVYQSRWWRRKMAGLKSLPLRQLPL